MENAVKKKLSPKVVLLIAIALIALFVAALAYQPNEKEPPEPKVDITVTLKNIVETSDLSTSVFKYEGIVEVPDPKKPKNIDYYICYSAEVYAGIDFSEVQFIEDKEKKAITAKLPEVKILDTVVDPNKLQFIYSILYKPCIFKAYRLLNVQTLCIFPCFCPYEPKQGKFLFSADYLIQQSCGSTLRFPCSVSVNVHCGTDISVSEKFLHIFRCCTV